jgi:hypothetical protein
MATPVSYTQHNFSGGELPPKQFARTDTRQYASSVETCENMLPDLEGPIYARPGTVRDLSTSISYTDKARLFSLAPSTNESFLFEISKDGIRVIDPRKSTTSQLDPIPSEEFAVVKNAGTAKLNGIYTKVELSEIPSHFPTPVSGTYGGFKYSGNKVYKKTSTDGTTNYTIHTVKTDYSEFLTGTGLTTRALDYEYTAIVIKEQDASNNTVTDLNTTEFNNPNTDIYYYYNGTGWRPSYQDHVTDYGTDFKDLDNSVPAEAARRLYYLGGDITRPDVSFHDAETIPAGFTIKYAVEDIPDLRITPNVDTLYITHKKYPPSILYRNAEGDWLFKAIDFEAGPYNPVTPESSDITMTLDDFDFRVSLHVVGTDFSASGLNLNAGDLISYRQNGEYVLSTFVSLDGTDTSRAIVKPVKSVATGVDPKSLIEAVPSGAKFNTINSGAAIATVLVSDGQIFSNDIVGSYIRFTDIEGTGQGTTKKWALIEQYYGIDEVHSTGGSTVYFPASSEVSVVKYDATVGVVTPAVEFDHVDGISTKDVTGTELNETFLRSDTAAFDLYYNSTDSLTYGKDEGRQIQFIISDQVINCTIKADAAQGTTKAKVVVDAPLPYDSDAKRTKEGVADVWRYGSFYTDNYPAANGFFAGRFLLGGTPTHPQTMWSSETDRFFNFSPVEIDNTVLATTSFSLVFAGASYSNIRWICGHSQVLVGMEGALWRVNQTNRVFSFSTVLVEKQADIGSILPPVALGNSLMMVHVSGRRIHEIRYNDNARSYEVDDGTRVPSHVFQKANEEIRTICILNAPEPSIWVTREDGVFISILPQYTARDTYFGVSRHNIGVAMAAAPCFDVDLAKEELYILTARRYDVYLERLSFKSTPNALTTRTEIVHLDSSITASSDTAKTDWTSEFAAYNESIVGVVADGEAVFQDYEIPASGLVLTTAASKVTVGFEYVAKVVFLPFAPELVRGNIGLMGLQSQLEEAYIRVKDSLDLYAGVKYADIYEHTFSGLDDILVDGFKKDSYERYEVSGAAGGLESYRVVINSTTEFFNVVRESTGFYTGDLKILVDSNTSRGQQLQIEQRKPFPLNILGVTIRGNLHKR